MIEFKFQLRQLVRHAGYGGWGQGSGIVLARGNMEWTNGWENVYVVSFCRAETVAHQYLTEEELCQGEPPKNV